MTGKVFWVNDDLAFYGLKETNGEIDLICS